MVCSYLVGTELQVSQLICQWTSGALCDLVNPELGTRGDWEGIIRQGIMMHCR